MAEDSDILALSATLLEALEHAGIGMSITSDDGERLERIYLNSAAARLFGWPEEERMTRPPMMPLAPEERVRLGEMRRRFLAGEPVPSTLETELERSDGSRVPVEVGMAITRYGERPVTVAFVHDITDRKRTEAALRASEARFRTVIEAAPDGILVVVCGQVVYANRVLLDMLGCTRAEELATWPALVAAGQPGESPARRELHLERLSGEPVTLELSSLAIEFEGEPAVLGFARDVTSRKQIEAQLIEADRLAAFGTLAAGVAHEINNPLAYVLLHLSSLRRRLDGLVADPSERARVIEQLDEALDGAERVRLIVADLLSLARSDSSGDGPADVVEVMRSALKIAGSTMRHRLTVAADLAPVPPAACGTARLGQVFLNLLINAAQSFGAANDPVRNRVRVRVASDEQGDILVEIEDNGAGMAEEIRDKAFLPFFTTKPSGVGTGLGLSICQSIVASSGGEIRLESRVGEGTRVTVMLPAAESARRGGPGGRTPVAPASTRARILVIDDEPLVARALASLLGVDHDVEVRCDSEEALALLEADAGFDLVLCDLMMPHLTGMELYTRISAARPGYMRRFIFMTGGAYTERAAAFGAGTEQPLLAKPFEIDEVLALVARQLALVEEGRAG